MTTSGSLTNKQKLDVVLQRNTFFFRSEDFEEKAEANISSITNLLLLLERELRTKHTIADKKHVVLDILKKKSDGLSALLILTSISEEYLLRLITFARIVKDEELNRLVNLDNFSGTSPDTEISKANLFKTVKTNPKLAMSVVNLLFEGFSVPILQKKLPLFELKKLNFGKLEFTTESLVDTLVRYAKRGSYKATGENDPVLLIKNLLAENKIPFITNTKVQGLNRKLDLVIPNKTKPRIFVESSFAVTTSSGMGDKAKTELGVKMNIGTHYPSTTFVGFVDGVGWYVRKQDLAKLVAAFDNVFTFKDTELTRFLEFVKSVI
jgi:hypothetical protein